MAVIFNNGQLFTTPQTVVKEIPFAAYLNHQKVLALVSEDESQVTLISLILSILKESKVPERSLLDWLPLNANFFLVTKDKAYLFTRHRDECAKVKIYDTCKVVGHRKGLVLLLKRLRLINSNVLFIDALLHGIIIKTVKMYQMTNDRISLIELVPPMLKSAKTLIALLSNSGSSAS